MILITLCKECKEQIEVTLEDCEIGNDFMCPNCSGQNSKLINISASTSCQNNPIVLPFAGGTVDTTPSLSREELCLIELKRYCIKEEDSNE